MKRKAQALQEVAEDEVSENSDEQTSETSSGSGSEGSGQTDSSSDSGSDGNDEVDVNFEFFDPQEIDFHGLKALLQTYLDGSSYSCSELVDTVIKQVQFVKSQHTLICVERRKVVMTFGMWLSENCWHGC